MNLFAVGGQSGEFSAAMMEGNCSGGRVWWEESRRLELLKYATRGTSCRQQTSGVTAP